MTTVSDHLKSRFLDTSLHTTWVDEDEGVATFPLWNLSGQMVGYQTYRLSGDKKKFNHPKEGRYFTYRKDKVIGVWGLESWSLSNTLFITEGVFDAARITHFGYSALAMIANDLDPSTARWLSVVRSSRKVVAVCDDDAAGKKLAKYGTEHHVVSGFHDIADADDDYVRNLLSLYS